AYTARVTIPALAWGWRSASGSSDAPEGGSGLNRNPEKVRRSTLQSPAEMPGSERLPGYGTKPQGASMKIDFLKILGCSLLAVLTVNLSAPAQAKQLTPKLYNNAKKKLLEGKTLSSYTVGKPDAALYCEVAKHYDFVWFEMQHSTMSWADIEKMIAACPHSVATPMV